MFVPTRVTFGEVRRLLNCTGDGSTEGWRVLLADVK
jgi:hypothetical protein